MPKAYEGTDIIEKSTCFRKRFFSGAGSDTGFFEKCSKIKVLAQSVNSTISCFALCSQSERTVIMKKLICVLSIFCILLLSACNAQDNTKEMTFEKENTLIPSSNIMSSDSTSQTNEDDISESAEETDVVTNTEIETTDTVSS